MERVTSNKGQEGTDRIGVGKREIELELVTTDKRFEELKPIWNSLCERSGCSIFQTFEWNRTWWKHFGNPGLLQILLVRKGEELAGIFPFFEDKVILMGNTVYCGLRFIGSNVSQPKKANLLGLISYTDYLEGIVHPDYEDEVYESVIQYLIRGLEQWDEMVLDVIPENSVFWTKALPIILEKKVRVSFSEQDPSQIVLCSDNWGEYLRKLNKNRRYKAKSALRKVRGEQDQKLFEVRSPQSESEFLDIWEKFVVLHQNKWNTLGSVGTFYETANLNFHKEVSLEFFRKGWAQFFLLTPVNETETYVAIDLNYTYNNKIYGVHTVTDANSKYYKESPGTVLFYETLYRAIDQKLYAYDFLRGKEEYKVAISDISQRNRTVRIRFRNDAEAYLHKTINKLLLLKRSVKRKKEEIKLRIKGKVRKYYGL